MNAAELGTEVVDEVVRLRNEGPPMVDAAGTPAVVDIDDGPTEDDATVEDTPAPPVKIPSVTAHNSFILWLVAKKNELIFACSLSRCTRQARRSAATGSTPHVGR